MHNKNDVYDILRQGSQKRRTAATLMNAHSRSGRGESEAGHGPNASWRPLNHSLEVVLRMRGLV